MSLNIDNELQYIEKVNKINNGKNLKYLILTMGCQLNENDSEKLCGMIEKMGYTKTENLQESDLVVFNTCCVRENAEDKLFGKLGEVKKVKEKRGTLIAIGGCMMQEKHIVEKLKQSYPFFDVIFGTHTLHQFPKDLYTKIIENKRIEDVLDIDGEIIEGLPIKRNDNIKASVTIMNGCNNFCSYCIVPYVRGRERSRNPEDVLNEVKDLAKQGYKEITLLGQNVNSYLKSGNIDFESHSEESKNIKSFAELLRAVNKIDGIERIRFVSPHPKDFTDDVIEAIRDCEKVCKIIHLPLQSGSTEVLKVMNRKYTKEQYLELAFKIRREIPDIAITTDIIVGFPGETKEDIDETLDVIRKVKYDNAFTFQYSKRTGTPAAAMDNQCSPEFVREQFDRVLSEVQLNAKNQVALLEGKIMDALVEEVNEHDSTLMTGRLSNNTIVHFPGDESLIGKIVPVKLSTCKGFYYIGELV